MDTRFTLHSITFEWDRRKSDQNYRKHGITFELACEAFFDPFVFYLDEEIVKDELRETIVGITTNWRLLYVVYVLRNDIVRIISARLVTNLEREQYENQ